MEYSRVDIRGVLLKEDGMIYQIKSLNATATLSSIGNLR
jgi:hypothetical protein